MSNIKKFLNILQFTIILLLLGIIFSMKGCETENLPPSSPSLEKVIEYDTVIKNNTVYVPKLVTQYISKIDTAFIFVKDSLKEQHKKDIVDYYTTKVFKDEKTSDSLDLTITDTIYQNNIISRELKYYLKLPPPPLPKIIYKDKILPDVGFYGGLGLAGVPSRIDYIGAELLYKTSKFSIYGVGIGVNSNFDPSISGKIYWKFKK